MPIYSGPTVATDVPLRNTGQQSRALFLGKLRGKHPACRPVCTLSQGLQKGVEGLGPWSETSDFSCLARGLQESWMNKCISKEFLSSAITALTRKGAQRGKVTCPRPCSLTTARADQTPWPPPNPSPELWAPHFRGSKVLGSHTSSPASCWPRAFPACCPYTPTLAAGLPGAQGLDLLLQTQSTPPSEAWGDDVDPTKCPSAFSQFAGNLELQSSHSTW